VKPVHVIGNHWALLAADVARRTVGLVDSLPSAASAAFVHLFQTYMAARTRTTEEELADWTPMSYWVCRRYVPRYCSPGSDVTYHRAGGVSAVVVM